MPSEDTQFKPGQSGNPKGRPVGSRNKLSQAFIDTLYADFQEKGPEVIDRLRVEQPGVYARVIASLVPKDIDVSLQGDMELKLVSFLDVSPEQLET